MGLCLSLTNYSLIPQEMMACGLPCVDLAGRSPEAVFGRDGPVELAQPDPIALADALERLLDDEHAWARRSEAGLGVRRRRDLGRAPRARSRRACARRSGSVGGIRQRPRQEQRHTDQRRKA